MGLRSSITKRIPVPNETDQWIEIQQLSWITLAESQQTRLRVLLGMRDLVALAQANTANGDAKAAVKADPFQAHDQMTLLRHGLVSWSYEAPLAPEELDEKTAEWAAREILAYTSPGEAEVKPPSSLSTGT